jgi:hypothetical protein
VEQVLPGWLVLVEGERRWGKCTGGWIQFTYGVHMYVNGKMIPVETILGMKVRGIKENDGGGEWKYDILDIL